MDFRILKRKLEIGKRIDDFLDNVSESGLLFKLGVDSYLKGNVESFEKKLEDITQTPKIREIPCGVLWRNSFICRP